MVSYVLTNDCDTAMLQEIRALQLALGISDAEMLRIARECAGTARLRCLEDCLAVELLEIRDELLLISEYELASV